MPNWVSNKLSLQGTPDLVDQVRSKLSQPYETNHLMFTEGGELTHVKSTQQYPISFWNIVAPTDLDHYFKEGWYSWNVKNWGCKWNACNIVMLDDTSDSYGTVTAHYLFDTPWSPPVEAIAKLSQQYPDLFIYHWYEEEQGWGGEVHWQHGEPLDCNEWDIPNSHAELMDRYDHCWACDNRQRDIYPDCPSAESVLTGIETTDKILSTSNSIGMGDNDE